MSKVILYLLLCIPTAMFASLPDDAHFIYPEVWHRQDSIVQILSEDSISWTDEYTMYAVVRSLQPDSTECLWSFTEDDTVSLAVLTDGTYIFPAGKIRSRHPADFSRWCVYAYHSGLRLDSTKSHSMRLGEQVVYRQDSIGLVTDTLPAAIEVEEIAYFRGNVSRLVSNALQTYLALKYGVTLDYAPYISQIGDTLWHPADDEEFYHRVMGIGNDMVCGWSSLVSHSKEDSLLSIRTDSLAPNEYILIGDDNGAANWREEYDGEYVLQRTWRLRRFTQQPKVVTLTLQLPALEETADSLRLKITDINGITLATILPDSLIEDSVCIFSICQADTIVQLRLYGVNPHPIQTEQSDPNQSSGSDTNESPLVFDATNKLLYISGYPDDQVFTLYLYDNVGKYITSVNTYNPVDVRTLPNTVFYIEVMTDNQLVGAINLPLSVFSYLRSSFHAQTPYDSYLFVASTDDRISKWLSVDPLADKYPNISPYAYCNWNPVKYVDPDGREWTDVDGNPVQDHSKIQAYIFYNPEEFKTQSYTHAIQYEMKHGRGTVAMSSVTTEAEFAKDWHDMGGNNIQEVSINHHGSNQAIHLDWQNKEYITSTGNGYTQSMKAKAMNVSDLGSPMGNISYATLFLNTCHSNSTGSRLGNIRIGNRRIPGTSATLVGSKETIMQSFWNNFNFNSIRGTSAGVSYDRYLQPEPQFFFQSWTYFNKH